MLFATILSCLLVGSLGFVARPPMPDNRIVGGVQTTIGAHPHQLSLQLSGEHYCGASVISPKWAITAGHCASYSASVYKVSAGSASTASGVKYGVKRVIVHPQYNGNTIDYDAALLEINGTIALGPNVRAISLASVELAANVPVNVTGWGSLNEGGSSSSTLQLVNVPIVSRASCASAYANLNPITPRMICAGLQNGGKDACQGDSGGPLTANNTLYGLVSWGYGCARPRYPGVYSNVANVRSWIRSVSGI